MHTLLKISVAMLFAFGIPHLAIGDGNDPKPTANKQVGLNAKYQTPVIPYPYEARRSHITGNGVIQVNFDDQGKVIKAVMVKSTDSNILDDAAIRFVKAYWKSSLTKPSTINVPLAFR